jgi:hypothetical protein
MLYTFGTTAYIASWNISISIPYFQQQRFELKTNIVPQGVAGSVFHSGQTDFAVLFTPAISKPLRSNTENAFQLQYGSVNPGDPFNQYTNTSNGPLSFRLTFHQVLTFLNMISHFLNTVTYREEQVEKSTPLNLLSQLLALIGGSVTFWGFAVKATDRAVMKKKKPAQAELEMNSPYH